MSSTKDFIGQDSDDVTSPASPQDNFSCYGFVANKLQHREFIKWLSKSQFPEHSHNKTFIGLIAENTLPITIKGYNDMLILTKVTSELIPMADLTRPAVETLNDIPMSERYILLSDCESSSIKECMSSQGKSSDDIKCLKKMAKRMGDMVVKTGIEPDEEEALTSDGMQRPMYLHRYEYVLFNYKEFANSMVKNPELLSDDALQLGDGKLDSLPFISELCNTLATSIKDDTENMNDIVQFLKTTPLYEKYKTSGIRNKLSESFDTIKHLCTWSQKKDVATFMKQLLTSRPDFNIDTNLVNSLMLLMKNSGLKFKNMNHIGNIKGNKKEINNDMAYYRCLHSISYTDDVSSITHDGILSPVYNHFRDYKPNTTTASEVYPHDIHIWPDLLYDSRKLVGSSRYSVHDYIFQILDYQTNAVKLANDTDDDMPIFQYQATCKLFRELNNPEKIVADGHPWDFRLTMRFYIDRNVFNQWLYDCMTLDGILLAKDTAFFLSMCNQTRQLIGNTHFNMSSTNAKGKGQEEEEKELANKSETELRDRVVIYQRTPQNSYHPSWRIKNEEVENRFNKLDIVTQKKETGKVTPFSYQKRNVIWMNDVENRVDSGEHTVRCPTLGLYLRNILANPYGDVSSTCPSVDMIELGGKPYYMNKTVQRIRFPSENGQPAYQQDMHCVRSGEKNVTMDLALSGGILADDVGLGKTLSTIYHIANQLEKDNERKSLPYDQGGWQLNNLIIVPARLLKQWELEIKKFFGTKHLSVMTIGGVSELRKLYKKIGVTLSADELKKEAKKQAIANKKREEAAKATEQNTDDTDDTDNADNVDNNENTNDAKSEDTTTVKPAKKSTSKKSTTKSTAKKTTTDKFDVYIVSVNLLADATKTKYWQDVMDNTPTKEVKDESGNVTGKEPEPYDIETCFDINRIKWNRVIVDEAHECVQALSIDGYNNGKANLSKDDTPRALYTIFNIQSNYRWGLTATPFEHKEFNLAGYLGFLSKDIKNDMSDLKVIKKLYLDTYHATTIGKKSIYKPNIFNANLGIYQSLGAITNYLDKTAVDNFQKMCISKTSKRSVSSELDIPIFTEDVIPITLGPIERNIYNNAKTDNSRTRDRLRRLFQLCTNICISKHDMASLELDLESNMMSLTDLNAAMITMFTKQQKNVSGKLKKKQNSLANYEACIDNADKIFKTMQNMEKRYRSPINHMSSRDKSDVDNYLRECYRASKLIEEHGAASHHVVNAYGQERANIFVSVIQLRNNLLDSMVDIDADGDIGISLAQSAAISILSEDTLAINLSNYWNEVKVLYLIRQILKWYHDNSSSTKKRYEEAIIRLERENTRLTNQIKLFENTDFLKEKTDEPCPICWAEYEPEDKVVITDCRHILCGECFEAIAGNNSTISCPECRAEVPVNKVKVTTMEEIIGDGDENDNKDGEAKTDKEDEESKWMQECIDKYGTKMATLIKLLRKMIKEDDEQGNKQRAIIFSQYDEMLKIIGQTLNEYDIPNIFPKGNIRSLSNAIDKFKSDDKYRVIMLSSERSNSGSNLTEANNVIIVDVLNMDAERTKEVESQIIGRAVRLGQKRPVKVVRLVTQNTVESEYFDANRYDIATIQ